MSEKNNAISQEHLQRGLQERHIQLIAIGGAIGVGLFLGSNSAIRTAGPGLMLSYLIGGIVIYIVMRALGEIAVDNPVSGSFSAYAHKFIGPCAGFVTGWTYWFVWIVTGMAEITAVGVYCNFWWPEVPQWIPALMALIAMTAVNLTAVKVFGEFEFWFALIKVVTICAMILAGIGMIFFGLGTSDGVATGMSNLYALEGGMFPHGMTGVLSALTMVMFAFVGVELIGVTAGEAANPEKSIPNAINKVMWRILIFYIGALLIIMCIFPWMEIGDKGSPFVLVFKGLGIGPAAAVINFVVLTAALSSCNSGIFSTGRMMYTLALQGQAPATFAKVNARMVPANGIIFSSICLLIGVILNYVLPESVFILLTSVATVPCIWIWGTIIVVQMLSRRGKSPDEIAALKFPTLWYPMGNYIALLALAGVCAILAIKTDTSISMILGPSWILFLIVVYILRSKGNEATSVEYNL